MTPKSTHTAIKNELKITKNGYLLSDNKLILTGNNKPSKIFGEHVKYKQLDKDFMYKPRMGIPGKYTQPTYKYML